MTYIAIIICIQKALWLALTYTQLRTVARCLRLTQADGSSAASVLLTPVSRFWIAIAVTLLSLNGIWTDRYNKASRSLFLLHC